MVISPADGIDDSLQRRTKRALQNFNRHLLITVFKVWPNEPLLSTRDEASRSVLPASLTFTQNRTTQSAKPACRSARSCRSRWGMSLAVPILIKRPDKVPAT